MDFYADWCGPCEYMKPFFESCEKDIEKKGVKCYRVNVDECEELAIANKINVIPCVIFFENGVEKDRFVGAKDASAIMDFVQKNI